MDSLISIFAVFCSFETMTIGDGFVALVVGMCGKETPHLSLPHLSVAILLLLSESMCEYDDDESMCGRRRNWLLLLLKLTHSFFFLRLI